MFALLNDILDDATYTAFMQVLLVCFFCRKCSRHRCPLVRLRNKLAAYAVDLQVVVSNLVDSNVFLRAVILSLEFFSSRNSELQVRPRARKHLLTCLVSIASSFCRVEYPAVRPKEAPLLVRPGCMQQELIPLLSLDSRHMGSIAVSQLSILVDGFGVTERAKDGEAGRYRSGAELMSRMRGYLLSAAGAGQQLRHGQVQDAAIPAAQHA